MRPSPRRLAFASFALALPILTSGCLTPSEGGVAAPGQPAQAATVAPAVLSAAPAPAATAGPTSPAAPAEPAGAPPAPPAPRAPEIGYAAHEWGTFTSVSGSDGVLLAGLHHEDEPLPDFVIGRTLAELGLPMNRFKSMESLPEQVTQKMETPVIYFHARAPIDVSVSVGFPGGIISQWFPSAADFAPAIGEMQALAGGAMTWEVSLAPGAEDDAALALPWVHEDDIWAPSRRVDAAPVRTAAGEWERFIFYRGLGRFAVPFTVRDDGGGQLALVNGSAQPIASLVLLRFDGERGAVAHLGSLAAGATQTAAPPDAWLPLDGYLAAAREALREGLEASGLYGDEALAMVDTWTASYFHTPGLRALYILPREWTDELLPLHLDPAPAALVRTLVGRVEIMTAADEQALLAQLETLRGAEALATTPPRTAPMEVPWSTLAALESHFGRFAEPRLRRAYALLPNGPLRAWLGEVLATIAVPTGP